ncbi:hypothetical protein [Pseudomonas sp. UBA1879]|uniref:hypothetical protein n=1 Tax=Pseudomonas sp. UBA1879 TaxID=1947305 RepID=UPI0025D3FBD0|nr:hypothetical protein [Pseudomonas sp. UBA1879]
MLRNRFDLTEAKILEQAEHDLSEVAAEAIYFPPPLDDRRYLQAFHYKLFADLYDWADELRTVDIFEDQTHFRVTHRIEPMANKLFKVLADANCPSGAGTGAIDCGECGAVWRSERDSSVS